VSTTAGEAVSYNRTKLQLLTDACLDFVFMYVEPRDGKRHPLTAVQELIVLNELRDFFCDGPMRTNVPKRNAVFMTLFHNTDAKKVSLLSKLTSLAVSLRVGPVLDSVAVLLVVRAILSMQRSSFLVKFSFRIRIH
jgi:hypothetical protein